MPSAREIARDHYGDRQRLVRATASAGLQMWRQVDPHDLLTSWARFLGQLGTILRGAQVAAASAADTFTTAVLEAQGIEVAAAGRVAATALGGVASDGRSLSTLLLNPVFAAEAALQKGADTATSLATGHASLEMLLRTQVADAGRVADGVAITARPRTGYTRMLVGDSCPKCAVLAGRFYRYSAGFERRPQCDCIHIPTVEDIAGDVTTDPQRAFDEGRVKGLSKADEQAIRDGADIGQVVNAHRGMYVAGARKVTREGATRQGFAGRRLRGQTRLMPEQIYRETTSRDEAVQMLRQHGYLI